MNINLTKQKDICSTDKNEKQLTLIKTYRNPYHNSNCYIDFESVSIPELVNTNIFQIIADKENSPLQMMFSSLETHKAKFLESQGFTKVRMCHELEVNINDLISALSCQKIELSRSYRGLEDYEASSQLLFEYYNEMHEPINPLSSTFEEFISNVPTEVLYYKNDSGIQHAAFVENNEIAYVCSRDKSTFENFAFTLVHDRLADHKSIFFEADNVDWAATTLKNLFSTDSRESFDTWIYKK